MNQKNSAQNQVASAMRLGFAYYRKLNKMFDKTLTDDLSPASTIEHQAHKIKEYQRVQNVVLEMLKKCQEPC